MVPTNRRTVFVHTGDGLSDLDESGRRKKLLDSHPVLFVHGNTCDGAIWKEFMSCFPPGKYSCLAPDLNGFGRTEFSPVDAQFGVQHWSEDIIALMDALYLGKVTLVCNSLGGIVGWYLLAHYPERLHTLVQIAPGSPLGFGGTKDAQGTPNFEDYAGSGAGMSNPDFIRRLVAADRSLKPPETTSPFWIFSEYIMRGKRKITATNDAFEGMLRMKLGEGAFPGDVRMTPNWPGYAPGNHGIVNSISPAYLSGKLDFGNRTSKKPCVYWLRGDQDQIVSDYSTSDPAVLGRAGLLPGWPGEEICPPQPMIAQVRHYLSNYRQNSGNYNEIVIKNAGHCPFFEQPQQCFSTLKEAGAFGI